MSNPFSSSRRAVLGGAVGAVGATGAVLGSGAPVSAAAAARLAMTQYGAGRLYLTIAGLAGDSESEEFPGAIELLDCTFGVDANVKVTSKAGTSDIATGKGEAAPFRFECQASKASPKLLLFSIQGKRVSSVTFNAVGALHSGGEDVNYLTVKMDGAYLTSYDVAVSETPIEKIAMVYERITYTYRYEDQSGTPTPVTVGWDFTAGKQL